MDVASNAFFVEVDALEATLVFNSWERVEWEASIAAGLSIVLTVHDREFLMLVFNYSVHWRVLKLSKDFQGLSFRLREQE